MKKITMSFKGKFTKSNFDPIDGLFIANEDERKTMIQIAAAPELLEALELALECIELDNPGGSVVANALHKFIAKVKGES